MGQGKSTVSRLAAVHIADWSLIFGTPCGPLGLPGVIPEHRHMWFKKNHRKKIFSVTFQG